MYRSKRWDYKSAYDHFWVNHQKKEHFLHNKVTGVQSGTLYIDNEWRRLRKKIAEQSAKSMPKRFITLKHVLAAAWLTRRSEQDVDATTKEICTAMGRTNWDEWDADGDKSDCEGANVSRSSDSESETP